MFISADLRSKGFKSSMKYLQRRTVNRSINWILEVSSTHLSLCFDCPQGPGMQRQYRVIKCRVYLINQLMYEAPGELRPAPPLLTDQCSIFPSKPCDFLCFLLFFFSSEGLKVATIQLTEFFPSFFPLLLPTNVFPRRLEDKQVESAEILCRT